ncbi:DUF4142 domain-containing protein [Mangrovibrevibacter kandeliae]|uniref:DUF4142 domain-containing protein n=1 Tax=Mangrovibrevibacter kandeliae TaxID=2968473 RepID=UPI00211881BC|nr:DUF4142 domain-containing protein [Aurantimonas sp. CSK15Z-1]MCQ8784008.1 DUF4142 domain-containing protein [Aurantimonas sp. CSK15Z-1]
MQRRHILASLAAATTALVVAPALAQSGSGDAMAMNDTATKWMNDTAMVGSLSLAMSRIALEKASDGMVKQFATFETSEQETIADVLMSMQMDPSKAQGALKKPTDAEVEPKIDQTGKDMLDKLRGMSGADFDKQYVMGQLDGHKKLLTIQEDYLKVGQNREPLDVAKLARATVREHITLLEGLQSKMG